MVTYSAEELSSPRYKIDDILRLVTAGKVRLPRFQRPLRWNTSDVQQFFDSIYRGYPIGTLLFWVKDAPAEEVFLGPVRVDTPAVQDAYWVVDGQQRVTSLAASLLSATVTQDSRFEIVFDLDDETFLPARPKDPDTRIPLRLAYDLQHVLTWLRDRSLSSEQQDRAFRLADRLRNYEIPAYLVRAESERALQTIFDRTNTFGKSMRRAEVFQALNSSALEPKADVSTLAEDVAARGYGELTGNTLLYSVLATRGPDVLREFRSEFRSDEELIGALALTRDSIWRVFDYLRNIDVPHLSVVPYQHLTVGLVRFFALYPTPSSNTLVHLRRWFWRAAVVGPIARLGTTGTLRGTCSAIAADGEYKSAERLLELVGGNLPTLELASYRWNSASTRIAACALSHLRPRDMSSGHLLPVTDLLDNGGRDALAPLLPMNRGGLHRSIANRVFAEPSTDGESLVLQALTASDAALASHCLDGQMVAQLRSGDDEAFLSLRNTAVKELTDSFVRARAEIDLPCRPELATLLLDESEAEELGIADQSP